ncbi:MAG: putative cytokinetic ring protein SteA, partial [bacterium]
MLRSFWKGMVVAEMEIRGIARIDSKTKLLIQRLKKGEIAVIDHKDIDVTSAQLLLERKPAAVINLSPSISGEYPAEGARLLLEKSVPIFDLEEGKLEGVEGEMVEIKGNEIWVNGKVVGRGRWLKIEEIGEKMEEGKRRLGEILKNFVENTLRYLEKEKDFFLQERFPFPELQTKIEGREVMVVVRGRNYKEDLESLRHFIEDVRPVLIGVDGGADALLEMGYKPHIIIGDMDSVSTSALYSGAELIAHAYPEPNRRSPGVERLRRLGLPFHEVPFPGLSEDLALLLAYEKGARLIVMVGSHYDLLDFLEKGRKGMSSTFLTRLKVGSLLVDAKGV